MCCAFLFRVEERGQDRVVLDGVHAGSGIPQLFKLRWIKEDLEPVRNVSVVVGNHCKLSLVVGSIPLADVLVLDNEEALQGSFMEEGNTRQQQQLESELIAPCPVSLKGVGFWGAYEGAVTRDTFTLEVSFLFASC